MTAAEQHNPQLIMQRARTAMRQAQKKTVRRSYFPHFDLSLAYTQRENVMGNTMNDFFTAQVGFTLPLWFWRNQSKKVKEAELLIDESLSNYENSLKQIQGRIADLCLILEEREKRIQLYRQGILLQGRQNLDAAVTAYEVDKIDFLSLVDSQKQLFSDEIAFARLVSDYEIVKVQIEEVVGKTVF